MSTPDGFSAFRAFLKTEFSDENIEFWMACEDYKKNKSSTKLVSKANKIYMEFIDVQAPREVRLHKKTFILNQWLYWSNQFLLLIQNNKTNITEL